MCRFRNNHSSLLRLLLEAEGKVVTREDLRAALWPEDTFADFERGVSPSHRPALGADHVSAVSEANGTMVPV